MGLNDVDNDKIIRKKINIYPFCHRVRPMYRSDIIFRMTRFAIGIRTSRRPEEKYKWSWLIDEKKKIINYWRPFCVVVGSFDRIVFTLYTIETREYNYDLSIVVISFRKIIFFFSKMARHSKNPAILKWSCTFMEFLSEKKNKNKIWLFQWFSTVRFAFKLDIIWYLILFGVREHRRYG